MPYQSLRIVRQRKNQTADFQDFGSRPEWLSKHTRLAPPQVPVPTPDRKSTQTGQRWVEAGKQLALMRFAYMNYSPATRRLHRWDTRPGPTGSFLEHRPGDSRPAWAHFAGRLNGAPDASQYRVRCERHGELRRVNLAPTACLTTTLTHLGDET